MITRIRRVVYLLAFLYFCLYAAYAQDDSYDDVGPTVRQVNASVIAVYRLLLQGRGCLSVLKEETKLCADNALLAQEAAGSVVSAVEGFEEKVNAGKVGSDGGATVEELLKQLQNAKEKIQETRDKVSKTKPLLGRAWQAQRACQISFDNVKYEVNRLAGNMPYFLELMNKTENVNDERAELKENSTATLEEANALEGKIAEAVELGLQSREMAEDQINAAEEAVKEALARLKEIKDNLPKQSPGEVKVEELETQIQEVVKMNEEVVTNGSMDQGGANTALADGGNTQQVDPNVDTIRVKIEEAKRVAAQEIEEERKAKKEEERRVREERERLEKEKKEREAKEEEERLEKRKKEEQARRAEEEERYRKAKEEEEAKKAREEQAKQELERMAKEEQAKIKMDISNGPLLANAPLPLLLLCVLGCTVVC